MLLKRQKRRRTRARFYLYTQSALIAHCHFRDETIFERPTGNSTGTSRCLCGRTDRNFATAKQAASGQASRKLREEIITVGSRYN